MKLLSNKNICFKALLNKTTIIVFTVIVLSASNVPAQPNHFLLLDSRIVKNVENAKLTVGTIKKHKANPLFIEDKPWEKRIDNLYGNVIYDEEEKIYKCWYSPFITDMSALGMSLEERDGIDYEPPNNREMGICYATSEDGISWQKPEMGLVEYDGNKNNNILWRGSGEREELWDGPHGSGIFKDYRDPDLNRRYKAIIKMDILSIAFSENGIDWDSAVACPEADVAGDTHNNALWAPTLGKYVGLTRTWGDEKGRQVARIESNDFIEWTAAEVVLEGIDINHQTYAMPVFYYAGIYIGLVAIHHQDSDRVWTELTWSHDTKSWNRVDPGTPLIPCSDTKLDYDYGCVYPCAYPVFLEDEIQLYYGGSDYLHNGWRSGSLCLATLRPDGFAGYEQESTDKPAIISTTIIPYTGQNLRINADVVKGGFIKVKVLDKNGYVLTSSESVSETVTNGEVDFRDKISSDEVSFQFVLNKSKLYSFKLEN